MKQMQELNNEINKLTLKIEQEYPELYQFLGENPVTIPNGGQPKVDNQNLSEYLESLKQLLKHHIDSHNTQ